MGLVTEIRSNHFLLSGRVNLANLMEVRQEIDDRLSLGADVTVDLSALEAEGFAVLALLVYIKRAVLQSGGSLRFENPSTRLRKIASVGGLVDILSLEPPPL